MRVFNIPELVASIVNNLLEAVNEFQDTYILLENVCMTVLNNSGAKLEQRGNLGDELAKLWRHYIPLARVDVLSCSLLINLLSLALPMLTLQVYDRILPNSATDTFRYLLLGLVIVLIIETILKAIRSWLAGWSGARYEHRAGTLAMDRLLKSKLESVEAVPAGIHLDRIAGVGAIRDFYASQASLAIIDIPFVVIFLALMAYIGGAIVFIPLVLLIVAVWFGLWLGEGLRHAIEDRGTWDDRRYNFIIETLGGIHTVKGVAMESLMLRRYERLMQSSAETGHRVALLSSASQSVGGLISQLTLAAVAGAGALAVVDGTMSIGGLAACTLLSGRTVQPVMRALQLWTRYQSIIVSEDKLAELDKLPEEDRSGKKQEVLNTIELDDVSFRFSPAMPFVLNGLNFSFGVGETIGVQGANGSGKTAFLHTLMGRLQAEQGSVFYNGLHGNEHDPDYIRNQVAYLPQRPVLLQGTVLDNLTFFRPDRYTDDALEFASFLGLDEVFARMPDGYDTRVGEASASSLPGGVAQRIVIARALAMRPRFILFDEANSALDYQGETLLKDLLKTIRNDVGIVLVTYRPSLLSLASRRYELKDGNLTLLQSEKAELQSIALEVQPATDRPKGGSHE